MWQRIKNFFLDSETIFWARLQSFIGVLATVLVAIEPTMIAPYLPPAWVPAWFIFNGFATEYLRKRRAADLRPQDRDPDYSGAS
ncbi:hypothetical protein [Chelativorans sp. AA-79]|uniref:hypothetical protein n=1 Tax=Chelativorans sp. AA-79 TaxID=3028735 RepID=UPI0023F95575|nr:hypothetical protein [Chelativorans sp. AA-79]WEX10265.1 hypothetical protein PVE73_04715 [Chelativorans sp. AA-79]